MKLYPRKIKEAIGKARKLNNGAKIILSLFLCWFFMGVVFDVRYAIIFTTSDGFINGFNFVDDDVVVLGIVILFFYWIFWGFKKDSTS